MPRNPRTGGGTASATSTEVSAVSAQAASALSQAISVLSQAISVVSTAASAAEAHASVASVAATSVDSRATSINNFLSGLSVRTSLAGVSVKGLQSVLNAISQRISVEAPLGGGGGSVTSTEVSAVSAQAASALSQALSVLSVTDAGLSARIDTVSNAASTVSANLATLSLAVSVLSQRMSTLAGGTAGQVLKKIDATNFNWTWSVDETAGGASVTSTELSAVSAQAASAINVVSVAVDALSNRVSAMSVRTRTLANITTISATTLTNISGLSASVEAGGVYQVQAQLMHVHSAVNAFGLGVTFPAMQRAGGQWIGYISVAAAGGTWGSAVRAAGQFNENGSGSICYSAVAGSSAVNYMALLWALFVVSTAGTIQLQARVSATGVGAIHFQIGSFLRVFRLN